LETEAKLYIQEKVKEGTYELVWSHIIEYENEFNPNKGSKALISAWKEFCSIRVEGDEKITGDIEKIEKCGVHGKDAVHLACALNARADYFITTDYKLIKRSKNIGYFRVINPIDFLILKETSDEDI